MFHDVFLWFKERDGAKLGNLQNKNLIFIAKICLRIRIQRPDEPMHIQNAPVHVAVKMDQRTRCINDQWDQ
jgi:hypothetical protein